MNKKRDKKKGIFLHHTYLLCEITMFFCARVSPLLECKVLEGGPCFGHPTGQHLAHRTPSANTCAVREHVRPYRWE